MESGHGKGLCNPISGTVKCKADHTVKNRKFVIQDAVDFCEWPRVTLPELAILTYLLKIMRILKSSYKPLAIIFEEFAGTMKMHAVHSIKPNTVWIRATACFSNKYLSYFISIGNML